MDSLRGGRPAVGSGRIHAAIRVTQPAKLIVSRSVTTALVDTESELDLALTDQSPSVSLPYLGQLFMATREIRLGLWTTIAIAWSVPSRLFKHPSETPLFDIVTVTM